MSARRKRPRKIMVIRHAEKPITSPSHYGVTLEGKREKECLTVRGWQRAGALAFLFAPPNNSFSHPALAKPQHLFASKPILRNGSLRPINTITPLAEKLAVRINSEFQKFETAAMLEDAFSCAGVVLISWQHVFIPDIANYILGSKKVSPQEWPEDRFDVVWIFERDELTGQYSFRQVPQRLLIGDSIKPIK